MECPNSCKKVVNSSKVSKEGVESVGFVKFITMEICGRLSVPSGFFLETVLQVLPYQKPYQRTCDYSCAVDEYSKHGSIIEKMTELSKVNEARTVLNRYSLTAQHPSFLSGFSKKMHHQPEVCELMFRPQLEQ